jgi:hypothetical protein
MEFAIVTPRFIEMSKKLLGNEAKAFDYRGYFGGKYREDVTELVELKV